MDFARRIGKKLAPDAKKDAEGRDVFGNRVQFVLCMYILTYSYA
jgi:hypothetical protein